MISSGNQTTVKLANQSTWNGDIRSELPNTLTENQLNNGWKPLNGQNLTTKNVVILDNSTWNGNGKLQGKETLDVTLSNNAAWNVTNTSLATSLKTDGTSTVTLGANSSLTVNGQVQGNITLHENTSFDATSAYGMRARFMSLDKVSVNLDQTQDVVLFVDAALNNGNQSPEALLQQAVDSVHTGDKQEVTLKVEAGLTTNGMETTVVGNQVNNTVTTTNQNLVTTSELVAIQMMQWRAEADDMNQRMGELRDSTDANGLWVRTYGGKAESTKVDNDFIGFQFGYDHSVAEGTNQPFVGAAINYTTGDANYSTGTGDNESFGITAYSTWIRDNGSYFDMLAKFGKLNSDFGIKTKVGDLNGDYSTQAIAFGVEAGHRFPVSNLFYVEPQLAFTASHIFGEDFGAGQDVVVEQDSIDSYVARAGLAVGIKCPDNKGSVWMKASYLYDFDGETTTIAKEKASVNEYAQDFGGGWYELGVGASVNFTKSLHGYVDFEYASGAEIETPYKWNVGVRYVY